jgi:hypothetical protein
LSPDVSQSFGLHCQLTGSSTERHLTVLRPNPLLYKHLLL